MTTEQFLRLADKAVLAFIIASVGAIVFSTITLDGVVYSEEGAVGADFLAFYAAGEFTVAGEALSAYDPYALNEAVKRRAPVENPGLTWQYPPAVFFLSAALTILPYKASYLVWMTLGWIALASAFYTIGVRGRTLRLVVLSPLCLIVFMLGQLSFLTAALLMLAAYDPKKRWLIAGIAAGLLTVKPQLGLLLPIAYIAVGAWRTIAVAVMATIIVHGLSFLVFGLEGWRTFLEAALRLNTDFINIGSYAPPMNMTTLFSQLRLLGVSSTVALPIQHIAALGICIAIWSVWCSKPDREDAHLAKCAVLCAGAILTTPYAYFYEMAALLPAAYYLGRRAGDWTSPLGLGLIAGWAAMANHHLIPDEPLQLPFLISAAAFSSALALAMGVQLNERRMQKSCVPQ